MNFSPWAEEVRRSERAFTLRTAALALVVALSRLPLLGTGLGTDTDGWALGRAARAIAASGVYHPSRQPGNPVQEFCCAAVAGAGDWAVNGLSALMALAAALLFAALLRRLGARVDALAGAALVFVPAVYIASASGMDYCWGLAFLLGAMLAVVRGRHALAGLLLGLAIGSRVTAAAFTLPLAVMAYVPGTATLARRLRGPFVLVALAMLVGALCFLPAWRSAGPGFLKYYEHVGGHSQGAGYFLRGMLHVFPLPFAPLLVAGQATVGVWGLFGCIALAIALLGALLAALRRATRSAGRRGAEFAGAREPGLDHPTDGEGDSESDLPALSRMPALYVSAWWIAVVIVVWLYLRLPDDEGYLVPMVPFTLLILATWLRPRAFRLLCVALMIAPFVLGMDSVPPKKGIAPQSLTSPAPAIASAGNVHLVLEPARGPLLVDLDKRRAMNRALAAARAAWTTLPRGSVVIGGVLAYALGDREPERSHPHLTDDILAESDVRALIASGAPVFYLPGAPERTARAFGYSLDSLGARPLR